MALEIIPAEHRDAVAGALDAVFGKTASPTLAPIIGGASGALTFKLEVGGRSYFLRLDARREALRNPHHYPCMRMASEAGVAPPLHHVDEAAGLVIMDLLPQRPLDQYPGGTTGLLGGLGELFARLQGDTAFPRFVPYFDFVQHLLGGAVRAHAPGVLDAVMEGFGRIRAAYPWNAAGLVSSHNDPNPNNVLYDGERLWLIDWETSYANDPLVDIAILANNMAPTPDLEAVLLESWLGRAPDAEVRARLALMRRVVRLYYAGIILNLFPPAEPYARLDAPTREQFVADAAAGRLQPGSPDVTRTIARISLAEFQQSIIDPAFERDLAAFA